MKPESKFWKLVKKNTPKIQWTRLESWASFGVPDLLGIVDRTSDEGYNLAQYGILVPSGKGEILAKALLFVLENGDVSKKMAGHAREYVIRRFSINRLVKDMEALYRELLGTDG